MSPHRFAASVLTPVILLCLTACGGDSGSEASPEATSASEPTPEPESEATPAPEPETFTVSGTYAEQGADPRSECASGEDEIIVKSARSSSPTAYGKTSAHGKFDKQAKACLYKFVVRKVPVDGSAYAIQIGNSEPTGFSREAPEDLLITGTAP